MQYDTVCVSYIHGAVVYTFTGDQWTIKTVERCLPIWVIETNSPIVCWHWLGSQLTEMICRNLCIDSVHPNRIDKHGR